MEILEPLFENTYKRASKHSVITLQLTQKISSDEKQKQNVKASRESSKVISEAIASM